MINLVRDRQCAAKGTTYYEVYYDGRLIGQIFTSPPWIWCEKTLQWLVLDKSRSKWCFTSNDPDGKPLLKPGTEWYRKTRKELVGELERLLS